MIPKRQLVNTLIPGKFQIAAGSRSRLSRLSEDIKNPAKWSAEYPNLYTLTFELINSFGKNC